jgi:hypothetical protein
LQATVFFPRPFPLDSILDFFFLGFFAAVVEVLFLPAGEWWLLVMGEVGDFFFNLSN